MDTKKLEEIELSIIETRAEIIQMAGEATKKETKDLNEKIAGALLDKLETLVLLKNLLTKNY